MIRLIMPKYPLMGMTEADAAEAARDTWDGLHPNMPSGMVQAWVDQKTLKRDILRVFTMSRFCSGIPIPREPWHFRSHSL